MAVIEGTSGNDTLIGTETSNNEINGLAGNDRIESHGLYDTLSGGSGDDTLTATGSNSRLAGDDGNDRLFSTGSDGSVSGGAGDDILTVGDGRNVTLKGDAGSDTYVIDWSNLTPGANHSINIYEPSGNAGDVDILDLTGVAASMGNVWFTYNGDWDLFVHVTDNSGAEIGSIVLKNQFDGRDYVSTGFIEFVRIGSTLYDLTTVNDGVTSYTLQYKPGQNYYWDEAPDLLNSIHSAGTGPGNDKAVAIYEYTTIHGFDGDDTLEAAARASRVDGGTGKDRLIASATSVSLNGGIGNDYLLVQDADDARLYGGDGNDTLSIDWDNATAASPYTATASGGSGNDILDLSAIAADLDHVEFVRGDQDSDLFVHILNDHGNRIGTVEITSQFYRWNTASSYRIETVKLGDQEFDLSFANSFEVLNSALAYGASDGNDTIVGLAANETIYGLAGNDTLTAGGGSFKLYGDSGDDTFYSLSFSGYMDGGEGNDTFILDLDKLESESTISVKGGRGGTDTLRITSSKFDFSDLKFVNDGIEIGNGTTLYSINMSLASYGGDYEIETLIFNGVSYDLTVADGSSEFEAYYHHGLTSGDDSFTATTDSVHGLEGNDTLTAAGTHVWAYGGIGNDILKAASASTILYGGVGDDALFNGGYGGSLRGGSGNDTYTVTSNGTFFELYISDREGGDNILDLTGIAENLEHVYFSAGSYGDLIINVYKTPVAEGGWGSDNHIARIFLDDYFGSDLYNWGTIVIESEEFYLGTFISEYQLRTYISTIIGDNVNNKVTGSDGDNRLYGYGGNDTLKGGLGNDTLYGDEGNDVLIGGEGADTLYADAGDDQLWAGADDTGDDLNFGGLGSDIVAGGAGDDTLVGDARTSDAITSGFGDDTLFGGNGNDLIITGGWKDPGDGTFAKANLLTDSIDANTAWAGDGNDTIYGSGGAETLSGGQHDDKIEAGAGDDLLYGGKGDGDDSLHGGDDDDVIYAGKGNDYINGGDGDDLLYNGAGDDTVLGSAGNDTLWGGGGDDQLTGGTGADIFAFTASSGHDTIVDFSTGTDIIDLTKAGIDDLSDIASAAVVGGKAGILLAIGASSSVFVIGMDMADVTTDTILI